MVNIYEDANKLSLTDYKKNFPKKEISRKLILASLISFLPVPALAGTCIQIDKINNDDVLGTGATTSVKCDPHSIAIGGGYGATSRAGGIAIGNQATAIGAENTIALGVASSALADTSMVIGYQAKVERSAKNGMAFGQNASVSSGEFGMAIGQGTQTTADYGMVIGYLAKVGQSAYSGMALGRRASVSGVLGLAIGQSAEATDQSYASVAVGLAAVVNGSYSAALGPYARADGPNTIALGYSSYAKGVKSLALGSYASATGNYGVAIGNTAKATGNKSISIGFGNTVSGNGSGAIGDPSTVSGSNSYSLGNNNTIEANNAFAIGNDITIPSDLNGAVVLGNASTVEAANPTSSTTLNGNNYSFAGGAPVAGDVVSVGKAGAERQLTHMAAGRLSDTSTDGVNGSQLFATNTEVNKLGTRMTNVEAAVNDMNAGNGVKYYRANSSKADASASGTDSLAMGAEATASGNNAVAMGTGAEAQAKNSVVLGSGASDNGRGAETYTGQYSGASNQSVGTVSVGNAATGETRTISNVADGRLANDAVNVRQLDGAVAESKRYTDDAIAHASAIEGGSYGRRMDKAEANITALRQGTSGIIQVKDTNGQASPTPTGNNSLAAGAGASASGNNSTALGNGAMAKSSNSVALGASSIAERDNSVSVGSKGHERQITHVAAATQGTDAVNYDQLKNSLANVGASSNAYTDRHVNQLRDEMARQNKRLSSGIASVIAMANLPQPVDPDASMISMGIGTYHSESGLALGISHRSENERWVTKASISTNTQGEWSLGIGTGYQF